eukprot:m.78965 g.78965  ORF g.78965 m.78965 type:complete len:1623 (-) comp12550_c1_seq1:258-5126(-)
MATLKRSQQLLDGLRQQLTTLSTESRKKPELKAQAESSLVRIQTPSICQASNVPQAISKALDVIGTFLTATHEIKSPKIQSCGINGLYVLLQNNAVDPASFGSVMDSLWALAECNSLEIKVLQCVLSLVTTTTELHDALMSRACVICFQLHFHKDPTTAAIAAATLRQIVTIVFERVIRPEAPDAPTLSDAFSLFQDLCLLTNGEQPTWFTGLTEMTRTLGLELIETAVQSHSKAFATFQEFKVLLKDKIFTLLCRLFGIAHQGDVASLQSSSSPTQATIPVFPVSLRLIRIMRVLVVEYPDVIPNEATTCVTTLASFLQPDRLLWHRVLSLEVCHNVLRVPHLILMYFGSSQQPQGIQQLEFMLNGIITVIRHVLQTSEGASVDSPASDKSSFLEWLDKSDVPQIAGNQALALALATLLNTVKSLSSLIKPTTQSTQSAQASASFSTSGVTGGESDSVGTVTGDGEDTDSDVFQDSLDQTNDKTTGAGSSTASSQPRLAPLVAATWQPIHAGLAILLQCSTSTQATDAILRALQSLLRICGACDVAAGRDAIVSTMCQMCLPQNFSWSAEVPSSGWQVTRKNLQCIHVLLNSALCLGDLLGSAFKSVISTLQQLVAILDIPHDVQGSFRSSAASNVQTAVPQAGRRSRHRRTSSGHFVSMTSSIASELPALGAMLSQLFEITHNFSDATLQHLITCLCAQSEFTLDCVVTAKQSHPIFRHDAFTFPVEKLLQVGLVNLHRIMAFWPMVTAHLIEVCSHPLSTLREKGVTALTHLVHSALSFPRDPPIQDAPGLQQAVLSPLRNLGTCPHNEVRKYQLECVKQVLDSCGQSLCHSWPVVLSIINDTLSGIAAVSDPVIVRTAFESMQMIVTDFLPTLPPRCLMLLIDTLGSFGKQKVAAVNVALTAVGQLWNVADYLSRNRVTVQERLEAMLLEDMPRGSSSQDPMKDEFDSDGLRRHVGVSDIWQRLYVQLGELCLAERPEVRRSACQTFYQTMSTHAHLLQVPEFEHVFQNVVMSTASSIQSAVAEANVSLDDAPAASSGFTSHHSNSPQQQWADTQSLTIMGLAQVAVACIDQLLQCKGFISMWRWYLALCHAWSKSTSKSVVEATVASFDTVCSLDSDSVLSRLEGGALGSISTVVTQSWQLVFDAWREIVASLASEAADLKHQTRTYAKLAHCFVAMNRNIVKFLSSDRVRAALLALHQLVAIQPDDAMYSSKMSALQEGVVEALTLLLPSAAFPYTDMKMLATVFEELLSCVAFAYEPPYMLRSKNTFIPFSTACLDLILSQFPLYCEDVGVVRSGVCASALRTLYPVLKAKHSGVARPFWRTAMAALVDITDFGLRGLASTASQADTVLQHVAEDLWRVIVETTEVALYPPEGAAVQEQTPEEIDTDRNLDIGIVKLFRDTVLPQTRESSRRGSSRAGVDVTVPPSALSAIIGIVKKGSIATLRRLNSDAKLAALDGGNDASQSPVSPSANGDQSVEGSDGLRDAFAQECFQALLDSTARPSSRCIDDVLVPGLEDRGVGVNEQGVVEAGAQEIAQECRSLLERHLLDITAGNLDATMLGQVVFVLKACKSFVTTSHRGLASNLFPLLVQCIVSPHAQVRVAIRDLLLQFAPLLD